MLIKSNYFFLNKKRNNHLILRMSGSPIHYSRYSLQISALKKALFSSCRLSLLLNISLKIESQYIKRDTGEMGRLCVQSREISISPGSKQTIQSVIIKTGDDAGKSPPSKHDLEKIKSNISLGSERIWKREILSFFIKTSFCWIYSRMFKKIRQKSAK